MRNIDKDKEDIQIILIGNTLAGRAFHSLAVRIRMMNQIGSCDKVAYQYAAGGAIARTSCPDGGKWTVELGILMKRLNNRRIFRVPYPKGETGPYY